MALEHWPSPEVFAAERSRRLVGKYAADPVGYAQDVLKISLWSKQAKILRSLLQPPYRTLVKSAHNVGKCLYYKDMIILADGQRVAAEELVGKHFYLLTLVANQVERVKASAEWNGQEAVYEIATETGKSIIRTQAHPLWVADAEFGDGKHTKIGKGRWLAVKELAVGQVVAMADELPAFGDEPLTSDEVKVVAYLIGDGCVIHRVIYSQLPGQCLEDFKQSCISLGCKVITNSRGNEHSVVGDGSNGRRFGSNVNPILNLVRKLGLAGKRANEKFVPEAIFRISREKMALFLSRLFSTDGWASVAKQGGRGEIGYSTISKKLAFDVQELLVRFGIHGFCKERVVKFKKKTGEIISSKGWVFSIHDHEQVKKFCDIIGIYGKEKAIERIRQSRKAGYSRTQWRYWNVPPGTRWEKVVSIQRRASAKTVAIEVPHHHTFLTSFFEHNSFTAAVAICWWFDTFKPGVCLSTAPTSRDVRDVLWKEIRLLRIRAGLGGFVGEEAPLLKDAPDHYAKGMTAAIGESFQGRHDCKMLAVFDEAIGIAGTFWETTRTMIKPELGHAWLAILNPTDTTKQPYLEEQARDSNGNPYWQVITMDGRDHPNISAQLSGLAGPYPAAISLAQLTEGIVNSSTPVLGDPLVTDVEWPPKSDKWWRPGPIAESRWLGRWPSAGTYGVWSEGLWLSAANAEPMFDRSARPRIGCDVARFGDDNTAFHVRWGPTSLHHEAWNGWSTTQTVGRLKQLAAEYAAYAGRFGIEINEREVLIIVDDDGVGGGVTDMLREARYNVRPIGAGTSAWNPADYPNLRCQLWFDLANRARAGLLSLKQLPQEVIHRLRQQAMAPVWKLDSAGRRVVEPKAETKKRIGRSPDDCDAMNLAYHEGGESVPDPQLMQTIAGTTRQPLMPRPTDQDDPSHEDEEQQSNACRRGFFGRK